MSKYVIRSIPLAGFHASGDALEQEIEFVEAQWWDDLSPLIVICIRYHGHLTKLRMDLDKKAFLDHLTNPRADMVIRGLATAVWEIVSKQRFQMQYAAR
jgi:hypothetical protein